MNVFKKDDGQACKFCGIFLKDEYHEEFDYFVHPNAKTTILALRRNLDTLPQDERLYEMDNWAVRKGIMTNVETSSSNARVTNGHKIPSGSIVLPAYDRLTNCYKWLKKLEERSKVEHVPPLAPGKELPF